MPAIHIIFKGWYSLIPEISHCYSTHLPQLYSPYSWNFRIVIPLSATIIQPIFLNFSHCYSTCLPQPYHMMSWDNWPPMPHLFRTFTQTKTNNIPAVFPQYSNPYSNPNLPPTNGKVDATPRWDPDYRHYSIYKRTTWNTGLILELHPLSHWWVAGWGWNRGWNTAGILQVYCLFLFVWRCGIGVALVVNCPMTSCDKVVADMWNNNAKSSGIWVV